MKIKSLPLIGFLQAAGIVAYIGMFVFLVHKIGMIFGNHPAPVIGMMVFLLAFVISALTCGSLALGYPAYLFFDGNHTMAVRIILWTAAWLIVAFAVILKISI